MRIDGPVLIALDGSPRSARTLAWGLDEAERRGASVVLARAYQDPVEYAWGWYPMMGDPGILGEAKEYLADVEDVTRRRYPHLQVSTELLHGAAVPELRDASAEAQLLVVGAGTSDGRPHIGSVATHLAAHGRCPVAVVRPEPPLEHEAIVPPEGRPVVVGVDGSRASLEAAQAAAAAAAARGVGLEVLHARPTVAAPFGTAVEPSLAASDPADPAHRAAREVADTLGAAHPELTVRTTLVDDDPAHALIDAGRHALLVVVGSRGLGSFRGMLLGAVSSHVARSAPCTVLVLHGDRDD